jgi:L-aspartate oxidase
MVFAEAAAASARRALRRLSRSLPNRIAPHRFPPVGRAARTRRHWLPLRKIMWLQVGIIRDGDGLKDAVATLRGLGRDAEDSFRQRGINADTLEYRNATLVGELIARSALARRESRGLHERTDYPHTDDDLRRSDTILKRKGR